MNFKPLKELVKIKGGKRLPKGEKLQTEPNTHPYIRIRDMGGRFLPRTGLEFVPDEVFPRIKNYIVNTNDVIISIVGTIGLISVIDEYFDNASQTENCAKLSGLDSVDSQFLYYSLVSRDGQQAIAEGTIGAVQPKLPLYNIEKIEINWPDRDVREKIVKSVGSLDDKIALNSQINQTLEAMAQALFKSWFVDFDPVKAKIEERANGGSDEAVSRAAMAVISNKSDEELAQFEQSNPEAYAQLAATADLFPESLVESELGLIPEGWEVKAAQELFDISIGKTPPRKEQHWFSVKQGNIKWLSIRDMGEGTVFSQETSESLTSEAVTKFNIKVMPKNTVFLSFKLTIGRVSIANNDMCTNEAIAHFPPNGKTPWSWLYLYLKTYNYSQLGSTSSIATAVNSKTIKAMPILISTEKILKSFKNSTDPIFEKIRCCEIENRQLIATRDTLLPKLIAGEIELAEAREELWSI